MRTIAVEFSKKSQNKIIEALKLYSPKEIGGILIGSKNLDGNFVITDVSISNESNQFHYSSYSRGPFIAQSLLKKHYNAKTGFYVGEWHSHPSFALYPSSQDISTLKGIINDSNYNVSFAILIIVKLSKDNKFELKGFLFHEELDDFVILE